MKFPTPYQRILRASQKGTGVRLSADEVRLMAAFDGEIIARACADDAAESGNTEGYVALEDMEKEGESE